MVGSAVPMIPHRRTFFILFTTSVPKLLLHTLPGCDRNITNFKTFGWSYNQSRIKIRQFPNRGCRQVFLLFCPCFVQFFNPQVNFVDGGANKQNSQTGEGTDWREQLGKLLPITLDEVRIYDGKISFRNFNSKPPVNMNATNVDASIYNLTNVVDKQGKRDARFEGKALLLGHAPLETTATFDPLSNFENFQFRLRAKDIELKSMNDFASAYGKFDFNAGHGDVVIEAQAKKAQVSGYIKPLLRDVEVFNWQQDVQNEKKSIFRSVWEALVGTSENLLKNQPKNQFATRVELSGSVHQQNVSAFSAFLAILRNGFIQAFNARYEQPKPSAD